MTAQLLINAIRLSPLLLVATWGVLCVPGGLFPLHFVLFVTFLSINLWCRSRLRKRYADDTTAAHAARLAVVPICAGLVLSFLPIWQFHPGEPVWDEEIHSHVLWDAGRINNGTSETNTYSEPGLRLPDNRRTAFASLT